MKNGFVYKQPSRRSSLSPRTGRGCPELVEGRVRGGATCAARAEAPSSAFGTFSPVRGEKAKLSGSSLVSLNMFTFLAFAAFMFVGAIIIAALAVAVTALKVTLKLVLLPLKLLFFPLVALLIIVKVVVLVAAGVVVIALLIPLAILIGLAALPFVIAATAS